MSRVDLMHIQMLIFTKHCDLLVMCMLIPKADSSHMCYNAVHKVQLSVHVRLLVFF